MLTDADADGDEVSVVEGLLVVEVELDDDGELDGVGAYNVNPVND